MLIYQTIPTHPAQPKEAILIQSHDWAFVVEGDRKIKWNQDFRNLADAFGAIGFYEIDGNGHLLNDAKGLYCINREWSGEIHEDEIKFCLEFGLEGAI